MEANTNMPQRKRFLNLEHWQIISIILVIYDILAVNFAYLFALWIRFDCEYSHIPAEYFQIFSIVAPFFALACVLVFWRMRQAATCRSMPLLQCLAFWRWSLSKIIIRSRKKVLKHLFSASCCIEEYPSDRLLCR